MTLTPKTRPNASAPSLPVSVWATAQSSPAKQRTGRYTPQGTPHPAKMLPAIAAHAIAAYTRPGDLVLDPMCGIGTTLVEALHSGRRAVGVEYEDRWAQVARTNVQLAREAGIEHKAAVFTGDARHLSTVLPAEYLGAVDLVITSPPYGDSTHGHVTMAPGQGVHKRNHRYGATLDRGNLANLGLARLLTGFTRILTATTLLLRPGGHVVITARPWRQHAELIDLPTHIITCAARAGLIPTERCLALLGRLADDDIIARSSFFQRDFVVKQRAAGLPLHLIAHEDVLIFTTPTRSRSSFELKHFRPRPHPGPETNPGADTGSGRYPDELAA
ncbi:TRM11 family methyltransferase [Nocardia sp. CS682]|uniref:TRM11 family SAM-dependent methyltransferase n=1 Tax=Nocardia sp. CS682 TaxID=1047172 RepID=UPI001F0D97A7|nr:DNA methyltransferase [Nocardia sp. CS682]